MGMTVLHHALTGFIINIFKRQVKVLHLLLLIKKNVLWDGVCVNVLASLIPIHFFTCIRLLLPSSYRL